MGKSQNHNPKPFIKSPAILRNEKKDKVESIRRRLNEMRLYKRLIAADGLEPDQDDKRIESELIIRLLRLERPDVKPAARPKKPEAEAAAVAVANPKKRPIRNKAPRRPHGG